MRMLSQFSQTVLDLLHSTKLSNAAATAAESPQQSLSSLCASKRVGRASKKCRNRKLFELPCQSTRLLSHLLALRSLYFSLMLCSLPAHVTLCWRWQRRGVSIWERGQRRQFAKAIVLLCVCVCECTSVYLCVGIYMLRHTHALIICKQYAWPKLQLLVSFRFVSRETKTTLQFFVFAAALHFKCIFYGLIFCACLCECVWVCQPQKQQQRHLPACRSVRYFAAFLFYARFYCVF